MHHQSRWRHGPWARSASWIMTAFALVAAVMLAPRAVQAQNILSVPFSRGFIGGTGSNTGQADTVKTFATLGITRMFFIQNSSGNTFQVQGNDITGTLRFVGTNGTSVDIPGAMVWRNSGGSAYLLGFVAATTVNGVTWNSGVQTLTFNDGSVGGGTNVGVYFNSYPVGSIPSPLDGTNQSGSANQGSALNALNDYLAEVNAARPAGPVTVNTVTASPSTPPTLTGTVTLQAGENLTVVVNGVQYSAPTVVVNSGNGTWSLTLPSALAAGTYSVSATITDADGYTLTDTSTNELTVASPLTIGGSFTANNKVYDGTVAATGDFSGLTLSGSPAGVTIVSATFAFQTSAAGTGKTVVITGITLGGPNAGLYTVDLTGAPTATAAITPKQLTISGLTASNKVYNGTNAATLTGTAVYGGLVSGESFSVTGTPSATFADANVGTGKAVTVGGYTVPNANYSLTQPAGLTANITAAPLTITVTAQSKVYDGNTTATLTGAAYVGLQNGETFSVTGTPVANFDNKNVGTAKPVTATGYTAPNSNYTVTQPTGVTANITAKALTISGTFTASNKPFDGTAVATVASNTLTLTGLEAGAVGNVSLTGLAAQFADANVGNGKNVTLTSASLTGTDAGNYTVSVAGVPTTTANITSAALTIGGSFTANDKVYNGTVAATGDFTGLTLSGSPAGVTITAVTFAFQTSAAGTGKTVVITGVTLGGPNGATYSVDLTGAPTATAAITPKQLTISGAFTANNKPFDGTTAATIASNTLTLTGLEAGDVGDVLLTGLAAAFADAAVGNGKTVSLTAASLTGSANANYSVTVTGAPTTTANITSATLTIGGSFTANDKVYNGTVGATGSIAGLTLSGLPAGVTIASATFAFQTSAAGTGKTVVITGITLGGPNAAAYTVDLTGAPTATAAITPKQLTISGAFTANNKPFDGTAAATIASNSLTLTGLEAGDVGNVSLTGLAAAFANAAVGNGKTVSLTAASLTGSANANYTVTVTGAPTTTANITSVALTIGGSFIADNKVYDATVAATGNTAGLTLAGSPAGVTIASVTLAFQTAPVGTGKTVVITGITLGGPNAGGYTLSLAGAPTAKAAITPRPVTIGGSFTAADKPFDNNTTATMTSRLLSVVGAINNDVLTLADIVVAFTEPTIGLRTVTIRSATLQGPQSANYTISYANAPTTTANILSVIPPGPPRNLLVVPGDGQLTVSWDLPLSEGCRPISGWVLEYSANNGATWTRITYETRLASPVVIRPVTNNVPYIVRVAATNACGTSEFAQHAPVTPIAAIRDGNGNLRNNAPGTSTVTTNGAPTTVTTRVVQDTSLVMTGPDFTLSLRGVDSTGTPLPIENMTLQLERGGRASTSGSGFAPGSIVSVFIFGPNGQPILLGTVVVRPDGTFDTSLPIPSTLPPGNYTLQVNGVDAQYRPRTVELGVQIVEPPAELQFTAVPSENQPAVGDTISITLTVTNVGRGPAIDVVIPRAFSEPGFRVVTATPQQGSYNASTGTWSIPRIEAGANAKLVFTVIVLPSTSSTGVTP